MRRSVWCVPGSLLLGHQGGVSLLNQGLARSAAVGSQLALGPASAPEGGVYRQATVPAPPTITSHRGAARFTH